MTLGNYMESKKKIFSTKERNKIRKHLAHVASARRQNGVNQSAYWNPLGVSQSGGSRYESEREIPRPVELLLALRAAGRITDADLLELNELLDDSAVAQPKAL